MWNGKDCDSVDKIEPIRQGDILKRFNNGHGDSIFVVITADCDIAQAKIVDSGIACVELQSLREYLSNDHLRRIIARHFESRHKDLRDWIKKRWEECPLARPQLSDQAINEWIDVAPANEMVEVLDLKEKKDVRFLEEILPNLQAAKVNLCSIRDARSTLRALHKLQKAPPKDWRSFVHGQLSKLQANQLPEDLFFISSIPNEQAMGYVVKLRNITFVGSSTIVNDVPSARERSIAFVRVARLSPTFKHGLAQQVGFLFARIGYPKEFESERDTIFELVVDELCKEFGETSD